MSPREKKLLIFFALGGFAVLNLLGYKVFATQQIAIKGEHARAKTQLDSARMISASRDEVDPVMAWIETNQPRPADYQLVQSALQDLAAKEATNAGLTPKTQKLLDTEQTGTHYHRAKFQITLSGTEQALFRWFDKLNEPTKLRAVTFLRLSPNKEDDTKIDCTAVVEQWFVPATTES